MDKSEARQTPDGRILCACVQTVRACVLDTSCSAYCVVRGSITTPHFLSQTTGFSGRVVRCTRVECWQLCICERSLSIVGATYEYATVRTYEKPVLAEAGDASC